MNEQTHDTRFGADGAPGAGVPRRDFLKLAGFSFAGAFLAGCERTRVEKAIPYLIQPEEIVPGTATWYASTCGGCPAACGILVKTREGRPIKVEGNPLHPLSQGGLCVVGQSMVLGLYDTHRLDGPLHSGSATTWADADAAIAAALASGGGRVRVVTGTQSGPTMRSSLERFARRFRDGQIVTFESVSYAAIADAHRVSHGQRTLPRYRFDRARAIVSFDADFLGTWISPVEFTKGYAQARDLANPDRYARHIQFESRLSITGAKADIRHALPPGIVRDRLEGLFRALQGSRTEDASVLAVARLLDAQKGRSLVVSGSNDLRDQLVVNRINDALSNYGSTVDLRTPGRQHLADDAAFAAFLRELESGSVDAVVFIGCNPVYGHPGGQRLASLLKKVPLTVSCAERVDETAAACAYVCPDHHPLESWSDAEPVEGIVSVAQPTIAPLRGTRAVVESLAAWTGTNADALSLMQEEWRRSVYPRRSGGGLFQEFWDTAVHDGIALLRTADGPVRRASSHALPPRRQATPGLALVLYPTVAMLDGRHAHNAWLQEVPDPVSKIAWDNYASLSPETARRLAVSNGDVVRISAEGSPSVELPAWVQDGQADDVVAVAVGYGRIGTDRFSGIGPQWTEARPTGGADGRVGVNAAVLASAQERVEFVTTGIMVERTGRRQDLACAQPYGSLNMPALGPGASVERRPLVQETTLAAYAADPSAGSLPKHPSKSLWPEEHRYDGHHWGMVIDPNACTGCSACVVSCQAENNIPVVGKDEVGRNRDMHWLRIDRYVTETAGRTDVAFQAMLCHHCDNAPCETVCPVEATVHSSEGLNQQVYNRCVGTRYCANNCPYKIRRFNWFDYAHGDDLQRMVLNPDVTVRSRGIMEKCSFCVQRIQEAKIEAKRTGRRVADGEVRTACQQSCPADAIVFGDMNDAASAVAARFQDPRTFRLLEELEVRPSVGYMTIVRNRPATEG